MGRAVSGGGDSLALLLLGLGLNKGLTVPGAKRALEGVASKVALAGLHSFAIDLSPACPPEMNAEDGMVLFLEALSNAYPEDEAADPPYRPAAEIRQRNEERLAQVRRRRAELQEARQRWEAEQAAEAASAAAGVEDTVRLVAGELPEGEALPVSPPPAPSAVEDPELEDAPERTVHVVFVGEQDGLNTMRSALNRLKGASDSPLEVAWAR